MNPTGGNKKERMAPTNPASSAGRDHPPKAEYRDLIVAQKHTNCKV